MSDQPTQSRHPWRAVGRTMAAVFAALLALLPLLPEIADALGVATVPAVVTALGITAAVTRVLAMPRVNEWLHRYVLTRWLAAEPRQPE